MPNETRRPQNAGDPDLNQYLRSPRPGSWLIMILVILLIAMVIVWAFLGNMKTTVSVTGIQEEGHFAGWLLPRDALSLQPGMAVDCGGETVGVLTGRDTMALTAEEVAQAVGNQYYLDRLDLNEYNLTVWADVAPGSCPDGIVTLEIVVGETRPFDFLMN